MEAQIRDQLTHELADSGAPPVGSLVTDAVAAGRRSRRRRRLAITASAAVTVVATASAGVLALSAMGGGSQVPAQAGGPRPAPTKAAPAATASPAAKQAIPPGHVATSGQAVVALLRELVPGGEVSEIDFFDSPGAAGGGFLYDDGHGAATVSAGVADKPADYGTGREGMQCPPNDDGFVCQHSTTPEGLEVRVLTMGPYGGDCSDRKCSIKDVRVEIGRPDGVYVTAEAYSGPSGHNRAATRSDTVLSVAELTAIAKDPRWGLTMDASFVNEAKRTIHQSGS
jgi:hypothetical protein